MSLKTVIFLIADAYGVLPPSASWIGIRPCTTLSPGFTSKVAGRECHEPVPTFSTCFGEPFLPLILHGAAMLAEKVEKAGAMYLVNTGWNGTGQRMKLRYTRAMVTAALTGEIEKADFVTDPTFGVQVTHGHRGRAQ